MLDVGRDTELTLRRWSSCDFLPAEPHPNGRAGSVDEAEGVRGRRREEGLHAGIPDAITHAHREVSRDVETQRVG